MSYIRDLDSRWDIFFSYKISKVYDENVPLHFFRTGHKATEVLSGENGHFIRVTGSRSSAKMRLGDARDAQSGNDKQATTQHIVSYRTRRTHGTGYCTRSSYPRPSSFFIWKSREYAGPGIRYPPSITIRPFGLHSQKSLGPFNSSQTGQKRNYECLTNESKDQIQWAE